MLENKQLINKRRKKYANYEEYVMNNVIDYNLVARYEAVRELINDVIGMFFALENSNKEFASKIKDRYIELMDERDKLSSEDTEAMDNIVKAYAPMVDEYYSNPLGFKFTEDILDIKP